MGAPKSYLDLEGSKEYMKRRKKKRERLQRRSYDDPSDTESFPEAWEMGDENHDMELEIEGEGRRRKRLASEEQRKKKTRRGALANMLGKHF